MSFDKFINTWLGKRIDYDHVFAYQCVDLILQYLKDVHGISSGVSGNAIDYWTKPSPRLLQDFEKKTGTPQRGDIVILNGLPGNPYGHIGVAVNSTTMLEQNGATGNGSGTGGDAIRYRTIPTSRVAGLLRKKVKENKMVTDQGLYIIARFYTGRDPSATEKAKYVGKVEFDKVAAIYAGSDEYNKVVASLKGASNGVKVAVLNHLPARLRG